MKRLEWRAGSVPAPLSGGALLFFAVSFILWWGDKKAPGLLPLVTGAAAAVLLLAGHGVIVDPEKKRLVRWWGLRIPFLPSLPFARKSRSLERHGAVVLRPVKRYYSNDHTYRTHSLELSGDGDELFRDVRAYPEARREGERLAAALHLAFRDETLQGPPSVREAGTMDQPLLERLKGRDLPAVARPAEAKLVMREEGEVRAFEIPRDIRGALEARRAVLTAMALLAATLWFELSFERSRALVWMNSAITGLLAAAAWATVRTATRRVWLEASPAGLRLVRKSFLVSSRTAIPAAELEELDVAPSRLDLSRPRVLGARSDRTVLEFGHGLPEAELEWVRSEAVAAIRGRRPPGA